MRVCHANAPAGYGAGITTWSSAAGDTQPLTARARSLFLSLSDLNCYFLSGASGRRGPSFGQGVISRRSASIGGAVYRMAAACLIRPVNRCATRRPDKTRSGAIRHVALIPTTFSAVQRFFHAVVHSPPKRRVAGLLHSCLGNHTVRCLCGNSPA